MDNVTNDAGLAQELSAIDKFVEAMRARMHEKAKEGYRGWDASPEYLRYVCCKANDYSVGFGNSEIVSRLEDAVSGEKYIDVANFAGMLWWRRREEAKKAHNDFVKSDC